MLTELNLVNACLIAIGNTTVPDLDMADVDTEAAQIKIQEAINDVLSRGWWFNTEVGRKFRPNSADGRIEMPKTLLSVRASVNSTLDTEQVATRGGFLYDMYNFTQDMSKATDNEGYISLDCIISLPLVDCPFNAQRLIRELAVLKMIQGYDHARDKLQAQQANVDQATIMLERDHIRITKENSSQSSMVAQFTAAVGGTYSFLGAPTRNPLGGRE